MHILLIKTSSLGDIIHTFPAVSDAIAHSPELKIDWVVEENFADIPALHPGVHRVIPVALRRWRKNLWRGDTRTQVRQFIGNLRQTSYDAVIDAQGLMKSAILSCLASGPRWGFNHASAREKLASIFYDHKIFVPKNLDALTRSRQLIAACLQYQCPQTIAQSGLLPSTSSWSDQILFLPGTTWENKKWPPAYWVKLAQILGHEGFKIDIPWSNAKEQAVAHQIQQAGDHVTVLPALSLKELASRLPHYRSVVAVDSGLGYLSAAFHVPTVMIFGPTTPDLLGTFPLVQHNIKSPLWCAPCRQRRCHNKTPSPVWPPCFETITPEMVWKVLKANSSLVQS